MSDSRKVTKPRAEWRVYKPRKSNDGAASKLELKVITDVKTKNDKTFKTREVQVFWVSAKQTGTDENDNASFAWKDNAQNVTIKLGEVDLGEILAVLNEKKSQSGAKSDKYNGIFHKNKSGNASFLLKREESGYNLRVSKKVGAEPPVEVKHQITFGEGEILRTVLEAAVNQIYRW